MDSLDDFIHAIAADPLDTTCRMAFADWLDENNKVWTCNFCDGYGTVMGAGPDRGNHVCSHCRGTREMGNGYADRARFIRLQVTGEEKDWACWVGGMIARYGNEWKGHPLRHLCSRPGEESGTKAQCGFRRGFVEVLGISPITFDEFGPALVRKHPVLEVSFLYTFTNDADLIRETGVVARIINEALRTAYYKLDTKAERDAFASRAAVRWARKEAGLPDIDPALLPWS